MENSFEPSVYFGPWSVKDYFKASQVLESLGVRFYSVEINEKNPEIEERIKGWGAWDEKAEDPFVHYELFIHPDDLERVGTTLMDNFPVRASFFPK